MLSKLRILAYSDEDLRAKIGEYEVQINPESYTHNFKTTFSEDRGIDTAAVIAKFKTHDPQDVKFDFFIDSTGVVPGVENVADEITKFRDLAYTYNGQIHSPNYLQLVWGDTFRVREIRIDGLEVAEPLQVAAAADVEGASLLWLDEAAVERRIDELAAVREAEVRRDWPRGVAIAVVEEQGWGYWQRGGVRSVIDPAGRVLSHARPPAPGAVTIFELAPPPGLGGELSPDPDTVALVHRLLTDGSLQRLRVRPEAFVFDPDRGLTVVIAGGPNARLGDSHDYEFKVAAWGALLDRIERDRLEVTELDLRFGRRMVLR